MKYFKILTGVFVLIIFIGLNATAQVPECPLGYTQASTTVVVGQNPSCVYTVYFCFKCNTIKIGTTNDYVFDFELKSIPYAKPPGGCTKYFGEIQAAAIEKITDPTYIKDFLCGDGYETQPDVPPCSTLGTQFTVTVNTKLCKIKYKELDLDGPIILDCPGDNLECHRVWRICWEPLPPPNGHYEITIIEGPTMVGDPYDCTIFDKPQYPLREPPDPADGNCSECFRVWGTPCTPYPPGEE